MSLKEYHKKYYEENKETILEKNKKYRDDHKNERKEYIRKYYEENKDRISQYKKNYRIKNKKLLDEKSKKYQNENKNQMVEYQKKYYIKNRETLTEKKKKKFECECGGKYTYNNKAQHFKSDRHKKFIEINININNTTE